MTTSSKRMRWEDQTITLMECVKKEGGKYKKYRGCFSVHDFYIYFFLWKIFKEKSFTDLKNKLIIQLHDTE